jgi:hypothetical protein
MDLSKMNTEEVQALLRHLAEWGAGVARAADT